MRGVEVVIRLTPRGWRNDQRDQHELHAIFHIVFFSIVFFTEYDELQGAGAHDNNGWTEQSWIGGFQRTKVPLTGRRIWTDHVWDFFLGC